MRHLDIVKLKKALLRSSAITIIILLLITFAEKYQEDKYNSSHIQIGKEVPISSNEDTEVSMGKLNISTVSSSLIEEITEIEAEQEVQMTAEAHQNTVRSITIIENVQPVEVVQEREYVTEPYIIECTAYNPTGQPCRDGTYPIEGETLAGKYSWLGRHCNLYYVNNDGSIGSMIGNYTFHDTGFGHDPDGDGIGSIQTGERIDLFMESYDQAVNWGVQKVYIEFLD